MENKRNMFVLVSFFEENKFSVLKASNVLPPSQLKELNIDNWDPAKTVEIKWNDGLYPGKFLQFGDNRNEMEKLIDEVVEGQVKIEEIPVLQKVPQKRNKIRSIDLEKIQVEEISKSKKQKLIALKKNELALLDMAKQKVLASECNCKQLAKENKVLQRQIATLEEERSKKEEERAKYKRKYRDMKKKVKDLNMQRAEENSSNTITLGSNLVIDKCKLSLCRLSDFSKYTCDLLDLVFGREALSNGVLKGIKGSKKEILNKNVISDIQGYVAQKFGVNVSLVRATIRNKLNTASKAAMKNVE